MVPDKEKDKGSDTITVTLNRVTVRDALDMVARLSGYRYVIVGSTFIVGTGAGIAAFSREASIGSASTRSIPFTYSDDTTLQDSVRKAFPNVNVSLVKVGSDAKEVANPQSNAQTGVPSGAGAIVQSFNR